MSNSEHAHVTALLELRALEKMACVLCEHIQQLAGAARARGTLQSREANLQIEVFAERRAQVMQLLDAGTPAVLDPRVARLEKLVEALELSRNYFRRM